jgi:UDP-3-O-[3-hydroxymyristoyl] glucosamine N-acyltransferase
MPLTAAQIAAQINGEILGDGRTELSGFAPADKAKPGDLTFAENHTYFTRADQSAASAIIVDTVFGPTSKTLIRVPSARIAFAQVLGFFFPSPTWLAGCIRPRRLPVRRRSIPRRGLDPTAWWERGADWATVRVAWRQSCGESDGAGGRDATVSASGGLSAHADWAAVRIHAGSVIGADGFGYVLDGGIHRKVPQIGQVVIHDDVEIGANVTIDRGALGPTIIGRGTKIDNLVQIAHNVTFGEHCLVIAQAGIAGSTKIGNYVILAGQAGLAGHLKIGNRVTVAAQSGVMHDIPDGDKWFGSPAQPDRRMKRQILAIQQLPQLLRRITELEQTVARLAGVGADAGSGEEPAARSTGQESAMTGGASSATEARG